MKIDNTNRARMVENSAMNLGIEFIAVIGVFIAAGYGVDRWLGSLPGFTIAGFALGFAGGLYRLIRQALEISKKCSDQANKNHNEK